MSPSFAKTLVEVVKEVKPSIVGIGVYAPMATVSNQLQGTGFVVGNGKYVVTNEHVINTELEEGIKSQRVVFVPNGRRTITLPIKQIYIHDRHDIAIVEIEQVLPPVKLTATDHIIDDGSSIAITGFPIGAVLGLFPATHAGIVAAMTPNIIPAQHSSQMSQQFVHQVTDPLMIYQLDLTAYPGNSGSPVYLAETGEVFGVINQVFIKETKESAIEDPSGITYAIPIGEVYRLAQKHGISL
ncbi:S1 family peptidase [Alteromonas facilis]|uniref:S1 family peptidase n=1 Tax=Alteromonas facilis TaxID=2048004 RepID=UPI001F0C27AA|nr:serine protease [Alteromonas facilis]